MGALSFGGEGGAAPPPLPTLWCRSIILPMTMNLPQGAPRAPLPAEACQTQTTGSSLSCPASRGLGFPSGAIKSSRVGL